MKQHVVVAAALVASFLSPARRAAAAGTPAWCGSASYDANSEDLRTVRMSKDIHDLLPAIANALCTPSPDLDPHRAEIEAARQRLGPELGMNDGDWADAAAWVKTNDRSFKATLSTKDLAQLTPLDQYQAISKGFEGIADALYATDVLDQHLTATGRLAFVDWCLQNDSVARADGDVSKWAVCWPDVEKLDAAKIFAEIRADGAHDGVAKMWLRFHLHDLPDAMKAVADRKAALIKKDDVYQKVFDVAAKARGEWTQEVGANAKLLALSLTMDGGAFFHSRKLLDGCQGKTEEALSTAISTIAAKSFIGMHDDREMSKKGFAESAAPLLVNTPAVNVAAIAYSECHPKTATADYLQAFLQNVPGARGPRNFALGAVMGETFTFDDMNAGKMQFPRFAPRPYGRSGGTIMSSGGVVKSVKPDKSALVVSLEKTTMKQEDCVKEHHSNHLSRIRGDGVIEYEMICDKTAIVTHDTTWTDFKINPAQAKLLKPGVVFSALYYNNLADVIAIWPNKTAKTPSVVLGGAIK
jgi:hypothetical protein